MEIFRKSFYEKQNLYNVIFKSDTRNGRLFDIYLLIVILFNVLLVILDSIAVLHAKLELLFKILEYTITFAFTIEYILRIYCHNKPLKYVFSFFGVIDFITIFCSYISFFVVGAQSIAIIRIFRLIRIFRILNMKNFIHEATNLMQALKKSFHKILIFMLFVLITSVILGTFMFLVEGDKNPDIASIPRGIYWAIVTVTTVGYGDITPITNIGMFISGVVMILGYSVIAVPTGILSADMVKYGEKNKMSRCPSCKNFNDENSIYCKYCGTIIKKAVESNTNKKVEEKPNPKGTNPTKHKKPKEVNPIKGNEEGIKHPPTNQNPTKTNPEAKPYRGKNVRNR